MIQFYITTNLEFKTHFSSKYHSISNLNNLQFVKKVCYVNIKFIFEANLRSPILNKKHLIRQKNSKTSHELPLSPDQYQYRKNRVWLASPAS